MTLWQRVLHEKRALILPLAIGAILNAAAYGLIVYPLGVKSAGADARAREAAAARKAAQEDFTAARDLVAGKSRADQELVTFYGDVLPADISAARRLTFVTLPQLALKTHVKFVARSQDAEPILRNAKFGRLHTRLALQGDYESFRQFLYELETAPEFIVIDNVALAQNDPAKPLTFTIELSTYYRLGPNGT